MFQKHLPTKRFRKPETQNSAEKLSAWITIAARISNRGGGLHPPGQFK
jgi:hypothetical protein